MNNLVLDEVENTFATFERQLKKSGSRPYAMRRTAEEHRIDVATARRRVRAGQLPQEVRDLARAAPKKITLNNLVQCARQQFSTKQLSWMRQFLGKRAYRRQAAHRKVEAVAPPAAMASGVSYFLVPSQLLQDLVDKVDLLQNTLVELRWPPAASTVLEEGEAAYNPEKEFVAPVTALRGLSLSTIRRDWLAAHPNEVSVSAHAASILVVCACLINDPKYGFWSGTRLEHRRGEVVDRSWRFNEEGARIMALLLSAFAQELSLNSGSDNLTCALAAVDAVTRDVGTELGRGDGKFLTLNRNQAEGLCMSWEDASG